ncbi:FecCD family ABC transporter permease [Actinomadura montaniterrae]|uniref:Iron chelate uptake ABC transporter family permease subunit n=1 Tax=Actinomadura montaniterrae TaxID=1803903 RepID=A0A6L3VJL9_9ACTN|nr:iron chelate uptake ABC transporter family permease subunit [Actinomadura montaniterrae]KAB2364118.1 iron chelate uptake ABC transporter family permease subunit [Actinomadura montaniterrae]
MMPLRGAGLSVRLSRRPLLTGLALLAAGLSVAVVTLGTGTVGLTPAEVLRTLAGGGPPGAALVVLDLRLPRVLDALLAGLALGMSGAVFQSLSRNPLGSPDIVGFGNGASAGALLAIIAFDAGTVPATLGALAGGALTALAVYLLAWRGGVHGGRLVLVGIGVSAALEAVIRFLFVRADLGKAAQAATWMVGSLGGRGRDDAAVAAGGLLVLGPLLFLQLRRLTMLEMGDDAASALGVPAERARLALLATATGLTAVAVAAAGPIPFVALAAPQLARRVTRAAGPGVLTAGLMGSLLVAAADWTAQRLSGSAPLPVGVVTGVLGGAYLAWLLVATRRGLAR